MRAPRIGGQWRGNGGRKRGGARRWVRRIVLVFFAVALVPLALTFVYRIPAVHPVSTLMLKDAVLLQDYDRRWTSIENLGPAIAHSVMMSEDGQFCSHDGIDWGALKPVLQNALAGEETRGASTIPMQTVKNLFLWSSRSYIRKVLEAPLALYFDFFVSKRRIMEIYLNIAEWGPGIYGAEAAAEHHFGKHARDLTARQAALLAVTLPDPDGRDPAHPPGWMKRIAGTIQARARKAGDYVACLKKEPDGSG